MGLLIPADIYISYKEVLVSELLKEIDEGKLHLNTRNWWEEKKQSDMIETMIVRIPMNDMWMYYEDDGDNIYVADGNQRLNAINNFVNEKDRRYLTFSLMEMKYLGEYEGMKYNYLTRNVQRRILETRVPIYVIQRGVPKDVRNDIISRVALNQKIS